MAFKYTRTIFSESDCDTNHCLVVAKVGERLALRKETAQKFDVKKFILKKLSELEVRKECRIEISNKFVALESLNDRYDINRVWENVKQNIKTSGRESLGQYELKQHKPRFDDECSRILDQRKQT